MHRTTALLLASGLTSAVALWPASSALAHGAPVKPISRTAACAAGGTDSRTAACAAAARANGGPFGNFDNLRVANVNGRDRELIPDGKLCSGGLPDFAGLDLARADWPATTVTAGRTLSIRYRATIPHQGSFRVYLTKPGYQPTKPLRWRDLPDTPLLRVTDPPLVDGAYRMTLTLPSDRTGRQLLYTIWQTSSTPDTYYSCSDLDVTAARTSASGPSAAGTPTRSRSASAPASSPANPATVAAPTDDASGVPLPSGQPAPHQSWFRRTSDDSTAALGRQIVTSALIVLAGVTGGWAFLGLRRGGRHGRRGRAKNR